MIITKKFAHAHNYVGRDEAGMIVIELSIRGKRTHCHVRDLMGGLFDAPVAVKTYLQYEGSIYECEAPQCPYRAHQTTGAELKLNGKVPLQ